MATFNFCDTVLLFGVALYWFFFFKLQDEVFVVMPKDDDFNTWVALLCFVAIAQSISILDMVCFPLDIEMPAEVNHKRIEPHSASFVQIYRQASTDVFFIDWEKARKVVKPGME